MIQKYHYGTAFQAGGWWHWVIRLIFLVNFRLSRKPKKAPFSSNGNQLKKLAKQSCEDNMVYIMYQNYKKIKIMASIVEICGIIFQPLKSTFCCHFVRGWALLTYWLQSIFYFVPARQPVMFRAMVRVCKILIFSTIEIFSWHPYI